MNITKKNHSISRVLKSNTAEKKTGNFYLGWFIVRVQNSTFSVHSCDTIYATMWVCNWITYSVFSTEQVYGQQSQSENNKYFRKGVPEQSRTLTYKTYTNPLQYQSEQRNGSLYILIIPCNNSKKCQYRFGTVVLGMKYLSASFELFLHNSVGYVFIDNFV